MILVNNQGFDNAPWLEVLGNLLPDMPVAEYPVDESSRNLVQYAAIWNHPKGDLIRYPNLKAILVLGSGTDHLDGDELPRVPIVRLIDPVIVQEMFLYALYWVLYFQRKFDAYQRCQDQRQWQRQNSKLPKDYRVTVLGLGDIGSEVAVRLAQMGFCTRGWSRNQKQLASVDCRAGEAELDGLLQVTDALVCCLPLTEKTRHILDGKRLNLLPKGAAVINMGRGGLIDDEAFVRALNEGQIGGAALDCFAKEPLPETSPYWDHPKVHVTPHIAGPTYAETAGVVLANHICTLERGDMPEIAFFPG